MAEKLNFIIFRAEFYLEKLHILQGMARPGIKPPQITNWDKFPEICSGDILTLLG